MEKPTKLAQIDCAIYEMEKPTKLAQIDCAIKQIINAGIGFGKDEIHNIKQLCDHETTVEMFKRIVMDVNEYEEGDAPVRTMTHLFQEDRLIKEYICYYFRYECEIEEMYKLLKFDIKNQLP